jgi:hypothetical protein
MPSRIAYVPAPATGRQQLVGRQALRAAAQADAEATVWSTQRSVSGSLRGLQIALPRWSPDGSRIAFIGGLMSDQGSTGGDIYAVPSRGGTLTNLTPGIHVTPSWLSWNNPQQLLVSQMRGGQSEIADYPSTATGPRRTTCCSPCRPASVMARTRWHYRCRTITRRWPCPELLCRCAGSACRRAHQYGRPRSPPSMPH